ncbi:MAG TPA: hypothetical protein VKA91_09625 [Nitrososphaeraceae archaeon]|nr:hypothetical protein [Nitrososphaeraceae archaeon]
MVIHTGCPAKSIKHKVTSDKLFLVAGREQQGLVDTKTEQSLQQSRIFAPHP